MNLEDLLKLIGDSKLNESRLSQFPNISSLWN